MSTVSIIGGGLSGSAAALAAIRAGASAVVYEKSALPRHKVCGEFLSPESEIAFRKLGVWEEFAALKPVRIHRASLIFGRREINWKLEDPAFGVSRFALDHLLQQACRSRGARIERAAVPAAPAPCVIAHGRKAAGRKGQRLFGFKTHFQGPINDAIELYFFDGCYAGVSAVENGETNVCGLAPESLLAAHDFDAGRLIASSGRLAGRLKSMEQAMEWLITGPVVYENRFRSEADEGCYLAGDALGFVDPFTGSGMLGALVTGRLAGEAAALGADAREHLANCRKALGRQYLAAAFFRAAVTSGLAALLAPVLPGKVLYNLTRPRVA